MVLIVEGLSKIFRKQGGGKFYPFKDVSFNLKDGENLGVIGRNGSGKSTLLRTLAGIYRKNSGRLLSKKDIVYFTGINYGLKSRLTMRENIYFIAALRGLDRNHVGEKFNRIVEFSGLRDYLDIPLKNFSNGMVNRLSFSIILHCLEDYRGVLLIDEALGGGSDSEFNARALVKMEELISGGASVIIVSHNMGVIEKYCDRVILLDGGRVISQGLPKDVIEDYRNLR